MTGTLCKKQAAKVGSMEWQWRHHLRRPKLIHQDPHTGSSRGIRQSHMSDATSQPGFKSEQAGLNRHLWV